ncbi:MAG: FtsH protease activity modulator HflK [Bacteriovoracaceae bacterium]|nr:FtsH protease activity modulator HflK [Bacteriovoracaceae bacterium]
MNWQTNNSRRGGKEDAEKLLQDIKNASKLIGPVVIGIIVLILATTSYYTVEPDEEAVMIRLGKYTGTYPPGLHFKVPFGIDKVIKVKTKKVHQAEFGFRTRNSSTRVTTYSKGSFDNEALMLTGDLNVADVEWVVQYQISDPFKYLFQTSEPNRNIRDVSEAIMRRVVGDRLVTDVLTTGRAEIAMDARMLMQKVLDKYDMGVRIVTVKLQDVNPPRVVQPSFNQVNSAKQEQEKIINTAEKDYNKIIPEARGKAEKLVSESEGYAEGLVNKALGDSAKFREIYKEYRKAPAITRKRIYLETMEEIFKRFESITVVDPQVKGLLPIFNQKGQ